MATTYENIEKDSRFADNKAAEKVALNEVDKTYGDMISKSDKYFDSQIQASKDWAEQQTNFQNQQTDLAIKEINQQKDQTKKDYIKEQSGAYVDWQKQSDQYGANAEQMAAQGLAGSGYSESSQVSMYNTYQNRVATARESYNRAVLNYDNAIAQAKLANSSALAEIAYKAQQQQLELSLQGFQYKNQLIIEKANKRTEVQQDYYNRSQDILDQINKEIAYKEEVRQYNATLAEQQRQHNAEMAYKNAALAEEKRQFDETQAAKGGGVISGGKKVTTTSNTKKGVDRIAQDDPQVKPTSKEPSGIANRNGNGWIEIPGHGRFSYSEVLAYVESGQVKETVVNGKYKYTWVSKKKTSKNVTPDAKGYAAKQKELLK